MPCRSVQAYLYNPRQVVDNQAQVDCMKIADAIVTAFEGNPLTALDVDAALDPSASAHDNGFNPKYLVGVNIDWWQGVVVPLSSSA